MKSPDEMVTGQHYVDRLYDIIGHTWKRPAAADALIWLFTEIGELADVMMRAGYGRRDDYSRNQQKEASTAQLQHELGDVQLMLCSLALALDLDLGAALQRRIAHYYEKYEEP